MVSSHAAEGARLLAQGRGEDAVRAFRMGLAASPGDADCHLGLARAYLALSNLGEARKALDRLLALHPDHLEAQSHLALLDADEGDDRALERLRAISGRPGAGFFEHFNLASALNRRGELDEAEAAFRRATEAQPRGAHAWFELGMISHRREDWARAVERFQKAAEFAPRSHVPLLMLARAHIQRGELGKAVDALKKGILISPKEEALYEELYKVCFTAGAYDGALTAAKALRQLHPDNVNYTYMQGVAQLTSGRVAEALATLKHAQALSASGTWEVRHALAKAHQLSGDEASALEILEELNEALPTQPEPANDLALLYLARNDPTAAVRVLGPVLEADPEHAGAHLNMALALARTEPPRALEHARKAQAAREREVAEQARRLVQKLEGR